MTHTEPQTTSDSPPGVQSDSAPDAASSIFQRLDTTAKFPYTRKEYLRRMLWMIVAATIYRFAPDILFRLLRLRFRLRQWLLRCFGAELAEGVNILPTARIRHPWLLRMGRYSCIADGVEIYNLGLIEIGDHTVISQHAHLCAGTHDHRRPDLPLQRSTIRIGSGVWICADAFIGPDVRIGDNALVAARAVVMRNVPANVIVAGNPARIVSPRPMPPKTDSEPIARAGESPQAG